MTSFEISLGRYCYQDRGRLGWRGLISREEAKGPTVGESCGDGELSLLITPRSTEEVREDFPKSLRDSECSVLQGFRVFSFATRIEPLSDALTHLGCGALSEAPKGNQSPTLLLTHLLPRGPVSYVFLPALLSEAPAKSFCFKRGDLVRASTTTPLRNRPWTGARARSTV